MFTQFLPEPEKFQNLKFGPLSCHIPAFTSSLYEQGAMHQRAYMSK